MATYVHLQKHLGFNGFWKPGTQSVQKIIYKSFEACGITTSDPSLIHCAKQTGAANPLYHQLQQWHKSNDTAPGDETFDTNDSGEATVLASDREDVNSDEFQDENFLDSDEVDAD